MGVQFLVDAGTCCSLLPRPLSMTQHSQSKPADIVLVSTNGSVIPTQGYETLSLSFGSAKYHWKFLVVDVPLPNLGANFLSHFHLLVDVAYLLLVNADSYMSTPHQPAPSDFALHISAPTDVYAPPPHVVPGILPSRSLPNAQVPAKHGIHHHIKTTVRPVFARFRHLAPDRLTAAKVTFAEMEKISLCQKASSPWSLPLHIILKQNGSLRSCGDYMRLNM
ncbi:uncharacterized protein [Palaemon carinicauda]|uniref:uncharacterized protein n=1 Tax=Palaemon carinicauda TaxID=392227 RepID=UPI0035B6ABA2